MQSRYETGMEQDIRNCLDWPHLPSLYASTGFSPEGGPLRRAKVRTSFWGNLPASAGRQREGDATWRDGGVPCQVALQTQGKIGITRKDPLSFYPIAKELPRGDSAERALIFYYKTVS